jgi:glycosyltransferase involved in cell wall biosynthesis
MITALLGRREQPTDGVADYCRFLGEALAKRGIPFETVEMPWSERGWSHGMRWLSERSESWRGNWVLLQYTALSWSSRGFPLRAPRVLRMLKRSGARCGVVFHDAFAFESPHLKDQIRLAVQYRVMRKLYEESDRSVLTVDPRTLAWLPADHSRASFIPIGANVPAYTSQRTFDPAKKPKVVAVFSVTDSGDMRAQEVSDIATAVRAAQAEAGPIRLEVFGRGAENAREPLAHELADSGIELRIHGVIPAEQITVLLAASDALLFVRGLATSKRGTAIAGIACGLPVVGFGEPGDDPAIDSAGVRLATWHQPRALAAELAKVLTDGPLWQELHERSLHAQAEYFSWDAVAARFVEALQSPGAAL